MSSPYKLPLITLGTVAFTCALGAWLNHTQPTPDASALTPTSHPQQDQRDAQDNGESLLKPLLPAHQ